MLWVWCKLFRKIDNATNAVRISLQSFFKGNCMGKIFVLRKPPDLQKERGGREIFGKEVCTVKNVGTSHESLPHGTLNSRFQYNSTFYCPSNYLYKARDFKYRVRHP